MLIVITRYSYNDDDVSSSHSQSLAEAYLGGPLAQSPFGQKIIFFTLKKICKLGWPPPLYEH